MLPVVVAGPEPKSMLGLPAFGFAEPGPLRDDLTAAVLSGRKVATSSLLVDYIVDREELPTVGRRSVIFDSALQPIAVIETTAVRLATIGTVDDAFAHAEGEGFADALAWRVAHESYWNGYLTEYRDGLADPGFSLTASTPVVCETFRLVARIDGGTWDRPPRIAEPSLRLDSTELAFVSAARSAILATTSATGRSRLVPICFVVGEDGLDGRLRLHSALDDKPKASSDPRVLARVRDLLARPDASLLVDRWSEDWDRLGWLRLDVRGAILEPRTSAGDERSGAILALRAKYPQYAAHRLEERPILRFTVERVVAWGNLDPD